MAQLFLGNIPHNCTVTEVQDWVVQHGFAVKSIRLVRELVTGQSPTFAYVKLQDEGQIETAINELKGHMIRDRTITVTKARETPGQ